MHANYAPVATSMMNPIMQTANEQQQHMIGFPLVHVEVKIRVPDHLVGRLIGKNGICLKKIMEETQSHISISEARNQQELQYQTPELPPLDRIITTRGMSFATVIEAEKNVQQKLRQFHEHDLNVAGVGPPLQQQTPAGVLLNTMDNLGPYAVATAPMLYHHRDHNANQSAAAYNAHQCIPMGVSPQSFYIQNPAATNFQLSTGNFAHMPNMPNSVHVKSRVYVPNQIVGILIGTKGQTIKSVIAESGAIISIEGDRDHQQRKFKRETASVQSAEKEMAAINSVTEQQPIAPDHKQIQKEPNESGCDGYGNLEMKTIAAVEPIAEVMNGGENAEGASTGRLDEEAETIAEKVPSEDITKGQRKALPSAIVPYESSQPEPDATATTNLTNGIKSNNDNSSNGMVSSQQDAGHKASEVGAVANNAHNNNNNGTTSAHHHGPGPSERSVFIQGYDFQVAKAQYWVFSKVSESQNKHPEEIVLTCEAIVPSKVIGRIIGKGGHNVKQLQQRSGAHVKVPDNINANDKNCVEAAVRVVGNYFAVQTVQHHFGTLITESEWRESREHDERRSRCFREGSR